MDFFLREEYPGGDTRRRNCPCRGVVKEGTVRGNCPRGNSPRTCENKQWRLSGGKGEARTHSPLQRGGVQMDIFV